VPAPPPAIGGPPWPPRRRRVALPAALFLATCVSTFWAGAANWQPVLYMTGYAQAGEVLRQRWPQGLAYMAAVVGILLAHEMGHFLMTLRHRVPASFPFFLPLPVLFGTMGAVIGMQGSRADRRQIFDVGVAGPLAGLAVAVPVLWIGVRQLEPVGLPGLGLAFHNPLLLQWMIGWLHPEYANRAVLHLNHFNPWLMAGWAGLFVTGLNMLPIGQFDGGHVAYALLGRRAHLLARALVVGTILFILVTELYVWVLMFVLVILLGTDHPPTANDSARLGWFRRLLGWITLTVPILCFPPLGITP